MRRSSRPQIHPTRTANGDGAVVVLELRSFVDKVLVEQGHVVEAVHMDILVIGEDEDDVRSFAC